jgi:3-hydroxyacyl-CoA dehydrogenase/enoyl-CoA hydratase/3-hydroxybutyryl-CoA epimerase
VANIFNLVVDESGVGVITFDVTGEAMNTWAERAFISFERVIQELEIAKGIRGVIFISGKPENFLSGADVKMLARIQSADEMSRILDHFHGSFARLVALGFPSIAAIHGHCLGGGLEFALACTARIAREGENTLIGLPECNMGLLPGWGGTQRLPRLIGYGAFELILKGTIISAAKAYELGILDRLIPAGGDLLAAARSFLEEILAGTAGLKRPVQDFSQIDAIAETAKAGIIKATQGREMPGPMLALKSMHQGLRLPLEQGLEIEKANFVEVVLSKEAKEGINTGFIKEMSEETDLE